MVLAIIIAVIVGYLLIGIAYGVKEQFNSPFMPDPFVPLAILLWPPFLILDILSGIVMVITDRIR